jgi:hypothetical protein
MTRTIFKLPRFGRLETTPHVAIRSRWVETADERCPIACTWFTVLEDLKAQDDESGSLQPAFLRLRWKAGVPYSFGALLRLRPSSCGFLEA